MTSARHAAASPPSRRRRAASVAAAAVCGLAVWTAFPPLNWWPAAIIGVAGFTLLTRVGGWWGTALRGWAFGLGMFVPMLSFLRGLGLDAWLILAVAEAGWFVLLALGTRAAMRRPWWPVTVALLWVTQEWARDRVPFGGFPWGRLAFAETHGPLLPFAAVGGAVLVTALAAAVGAVLAWAVVVARRHAGWWRPVVTVAVAAGVCVGGAALVPVGTAGSTERGPASVVVGVVQGNVPRLGLDEFAQRRAVTANHETETEALADAVRAGDVPAPQLVVWPENASDDDPYHDPQARAMIERAVAAVGVPVLVGAVLDGPGTDHVRNAAIVWSPDTGPGEVYVKRHLVPFGEYLPWRSVLSRFIGRFSLIPRDFARGSMPGVLQVGPAKIADVICFEVADDQVVRDAVTGGGRLLVVQTNNATYEHVGDSGTGGETAQQLEISRLRAVEHGRAVVVAATSGVSAVIAPDGTVLQQTGVFEPAHLVARLPLRDAQTLADRLGAWPERVLAALGVLLCLVSLRRRRDDDATTAETPPAAVLVAQP